MFPITRKPTGPPPGKGRIHSVLSLILPRMRGALTLAGNHFRVLHIIHCCEMLSIRETYLIQGKVPGAHTEFTYRIYTHVRVLKSDNDHYMDLNPAYLVFICCVYVVI